MSRILLADDHKLIAEAVASLLGTTGEFAVDTAETFQDVIHCLSQNDTYNIVMLDLRMPGLVGMDDIRQVVVQAGTGYVVLFSSNADRHTLKRAMDCGVRGLIPKTMPLQSLVSVLRLIETGQMFVPATAGDTDDNTDARAKLSDIELYVLRLAASGLTNKHIANDMKQSETTIKMHMRSICRKLGARNRAHAAVIGRDMAIIDT
ncbi:MAG: response regulator transcription factor [Rhodobacterales bacterium]|nr:response regulator transcription factor [Rhodobacterales bacterium]